NTHTTTNNKFVAIRIYAGCGRGGGGLPPTTSTQCVSPNVLTLAVIHHGVAFPLVWMMLDKKVTPTPKSFVNYGIVS
ncbi:MAG: hypothetical protein ACK48A_20840, partial [Pseudanabaena sp.]